MKDHYRAVRWLLIFAVLSLVALLVPWEGGDRQSIGDPLPAAPLDPTSAAGLIQPDPGPSRERQPSALSQGHVTIRTRLSWGVLAEQETCRISLRGAAKDGGASLLVNANCPIPGSIELDLSLLGGPVVVHAHSDFTFLEQAVTLENPLPDEVELVLEPLGKLVLEVLDVPSPRTEPSADTQNRPVVDT